MSDDAILLECRGVSKSFGRNKVLQDIDLLIRKGEVHALLGQNGAGKSTLVKIITGVYDKDSGDILFAGKPARLESPVDAEALGIAIIHQDQQLVPYFDVTRNAFLGDELRTRTGFLDFNTMRSLVEEKLRLISADFSADRQISSLTVGQREQVAIVSALLRNPKLLILDEPTASLSNKEIERLFEIIAMLKSNGVTIVYISHHLDEVFRIADTMTVLRDSRNQGTVDREAATKEAIVSMMIGRDLKDFYPKDTAPIGKPLLEVKDLRQGTMVNGVDFVLREGEILGIAGLVGAGRTETMLAIYGAEKPRSGTILIDGHEFKPGSPGHAKKAGIAFIPEDRRSEGIVAEMGIGQNLSLADTDLFARRGIIDRKKERNRSNAVIEALNIVCTGYRQPVGELSGGNQQKVVIGRWMSGDARIFIFDQPTTGVDVGAKTEIYKVMMKCAKNGGGIIFISSENEELLGICDRILVMAKGKVVAEFSSADATEEKLLYWSSSGSESAASD